MIHEAVFIRRRLFALGALASFACGVAMADGLHETSVYEVPGTATTVSWGIQTDENGRDTAVYSIVRGGKTIADAKRAEYNIRLRYASFDPEVYVPAVNPVLAAGDDNRLFIVQFHTPMIDGYRSELEADGVTLLKFLANQAFIVEMDPSAQDTIAKLPFVRWVGAYQPAYRLDPALIPELFPVSGGQETGAIAALQDEQASTALGIDQGQGAGNSVEYSIMMTRRGPVPQQIVADRIRALGGNVLQTIPQGFRIRATLNPTQLASVLKMNEVLFVDEQGVQENDMDIAREIGGANRLENELGMSGQGVRAEVMDDGVRASHEQFDGQVIVHAQNSGGNSHGTSTFGIVFASGTGNATARGMLPDADAKIICDYDLVLNQSQNRYGLTAELVDPNGPYRAVLQSNSWGNNRTRSYTTISAEMDDILFINDITVCQSQSNAGNQDSRPQAWAKNMVSVGGVYHRNTLVKTDDAWSFGGSTGPAADGRIKPEFTHFYDNVYTTSYSCDNCYTSSFGGTSAATPITAGHFGLFYQMWHEGVFPGFGGGPDVFTDRAHSATAKAVMVNAAVPYSGGDFNRDRQGWGMADLGYLIDHANEMLIIDESDVLGQGDVTTYHVDVQPGAERLRVTMVYLDPMGNPANQVARINDVSLQVTAPDNTIYWGNNGMAGTSNVSTPGGDENHVDTVENVFIDSPMAGTWTIRVRATEVNEDGHVETQELDVDYALVISGQGGGMRIARSGNCPGQVTLSWDGAPNNVTLGLLYANGTGNASIPGGSPCAGTVLGLSNNGLRLVTYLNSGNGSGSIQRNVNAQACPGYLQMVDGSTCGTSNVVQVGP